MRSVCRTIADNPIKVVRSPILNVGFDVCSPTGCFGSPRKFEQMRQWVHGTANLPDGWHELVVYLFDIEDRIVEIKSVLFWVGDYWAVQRRTPKPTFVDTIWHTERQKQMESRHTDVPVHMTQSCALAERAEISFSGLGPSSSAWTYDGPELRDKGFVALSNLLSHEQVEVANAQIDQYIQSIIDIHGNGPFAGGRLHDIQQADATIYRDAFSLPNSSIIIHNLLEKGNSFRYIADHPMLQGIVRTHLGSKFKLNSMQFRSLAPGVAHEDWHTDGSLEWAVSDADMIQTVFSIVWLDDMTRENGATGYVRGSFRHVVAKNIVAIKVATGHHFNPENLKNRTELSGDLPWGSAGQVEYPTGQRGGAVAYNGFSLHAAGANLSPARRRILILGWCRQEHETTDKTQGVPDVSLAKANLKCRQMLSQSTLASRSNQYVSQRWIDIDHWREGLWGIRKDLVQPISERHVVELSDIATTYTSNESLDPVFSLKLSSGRLHLRCANDRLGRVQWVYKRKHTVPSPTDAVQSNVSPSIVLSCTNSQYELSAFHHNTTALAAVASCADRRGRNLHPIARFSARRDCGARSASAPLPHLVARPLHVSILLLDSVSRSCFMRNFPQTVQLLEDWGRMARIHSEQQHVFQFSNFHTFGPSTADSVPLLLLGEADSPSESIFNHFKQNGGYVTAAVTSDAHWFHLRNGVYSFDHDAFIDHVVSFNCIMRLLDSEPLDVAKGLNYNCAGQHCATSFLLAYLRALQIEHEQMPILSFLHDFSYPGEKEHEGSSAALSRLDQQYSSHLQDEVKSGNKFMVMMADHGPRFGALARVAWYSRQDMLNPLLVILAPCVHLHKAAVQNLEGNQQRLVTIKDVRKTVEDIPLAQTRTFNTTSMPCQGAWCNLMRSKIPEKRSCAQSGISSVWCSHNELVRFSYTVQQGKALLQLALASINRKNILHLDRCHNLFPMHFQIKLAEAWSTLSGMLDTLAVTVVANSSLFSSTVDHHLSFQAIFQDKEDHTQPENRFVAEDSAPILMRRVSPYEKESCTKHDHKTVREFCVCLSDSSFSE